MTKVHNQVSWQIPPDLAFDKPPLLESSFVKNKEARASRNKDIDG